MQFSLFAPLRGQSFPQRVFEHVCLSTCVRSVFSRVAVCLAVVCMAVPSVAVRIPADSLSHCRDAAFSLRQLVVPGALVVTGSVGVCNGYAHRLRGDVRKDMSKMRGTCYMHADDYLQYLPTAAHVGLGAVGVPSRHPFRERAAAQLTAWTAMAVMVNVTKVSVREPRPDSRARNSFPSGHTATAFMGAELVREEYGNAWGAGAYAFATGIALLRLYNDRHWTNDVVAGAGFGILAARVGYWLLPLERRLLGWNKGTAAVAALPAYDATGCGLCLTVAAAF